MEGSRAACRSPARDWDRSLCGEEPQRPDPVAHATSRASSRRSPDSRVSADNAPGPDASRDGGEAQMLAVGLRCLASQLLVGREYRAERIKSVLAGFLSRPALAHRSGDLEYAGNDPPVLVRRIEGNREIDRCGHRGHRTRLPASRPSHPLVAPTLPCPGDQGQGRWGAWHIVCRRLATRSSSSVAKSLTNRRWRSTSSSWIALSRP